MRAITGYAIEATDGRIGRIADFLPTGDPWTIDALAVGWLGRSVHVDLSRTALRRAA